MNLAVFSKDMTRRDAICSHLAANGIAVDRFDDETTFARALTRREFDAILISMERASIRSIPCSSIARATASSARR